MSDTPPTKPKPGSLRDRIAAFEKPASSSAAPKPPPVRPKPGNIGWKPTPPSPPSNATENTEYEERKTGGMSASDAKESIGKGGSLKERMAALQGKGAFGGGVAPVPPPVKAVKRQPLVVPPPPKEESDEQPTDPDAGEPRDERARSDQPSESEARDDTDVARTGPNDDIPKEKDALVEEEQDEEAKERERRAAIAARMARLGGARVGMAPPMFGKRPEVKEKPKVTPPEDTGSPIASEKTTAPVEEPVSATSPLSLKEDSLSEVNNAGLDIPQVVTDKEVTPDEAWAVPPSSLLSPPSALESPSAVDSESHSAPDVTSSQSSHLSSRSHPISIPIPAVPRRAGPPRKKSARTLKVEEKAQGHEIREVSLVPAEASAIVEVPNINPSAQHETSPAADQGPGSDHELSAETDSAYVHEARSDQDLNTVAEIGGHAGLAVKEDVIDDDDLVQRIHESPEEAIPEGPHELTTDVNERPQIDVSHIPEPETHTPTVEASAAHETQTISEPRVYEGLSSLLVDKQELHELSDFEASAGDEQGAEVDNRMTRADNSSDLSPVISTIVSTVAVAAHEPIEVVSEGSQLAPILDRRESEPQIMAVENSVEDEEADRKKRIAERLAKMGGRNPFTVGLGVAAPPGHIGGDEPHEPVRHVSSYGESTIGEQTYADSALTKPHTQIHSHEVDGQEPHVSSVTEEYYSALTALEESHEEDEAIDPEPNPPHLEQLAPTPHSEAEDYLETSPNEQESPYTGEESDQMAPPRITRAIPPPPPPQRTVSLVAREISPLTHDALETDDGINISTPRSVSPDQMHTVASDLISDSITSVRTVRKDSEMNSPSSPPMSTHSPPRAAPSTSPITDSTEFRPVSSNSSRRSFSPPPRAVPASPDDGHPSIREFSPPTSFRTAVHPPARPPVPQTARSSSPEVSLTQSRRTSIRRSIPPPPLPSSTQTNEGPVSPPLKPVPLQSVEVIPATIRRASSGDASEPTHPRMAAPAIQIIPRDSIEEQEVLAESEPDPIDPAFYSPPRSPATPREQRASVFKSNSREPSENNAEAEAEQSRRQTIAERMAKLGGIRLGAPPLIPRKPPAPQPESPPAHEVGPEVGEQELDVKEKEVDAVGSEEPADAGEAERVRRQAIAARLAGLGGMRFGMLPQVSSHPNPRAAFDLSSPQAAEYVSDPPQPLSSIEPAIAETDLDSVSDDGVKVEAESELSMEEVNPEDAVETPEEILPPVPSRPSRTSHPPPFEVPPPLPGGRRSHATMSPPPSRPPMPKTEPMRSDSVRKASGSSGFHVSPTSDFVMVDENQDVSPPPPPPPRSRPSRPPMPPSAPSKDLESPSWELPEIPRGSFDVNVPSNLGMDMSISLEDSTTYPPPHAPQVSAPPVEPPRPPAPTVMAEVQLSADDLMELWGAIGTQVHASASGLFDQSKKSVVGDGTTHGFVQAALAQVPRASRASYGHLIYAQTGNSVLRRSSNIMPGDIVQLSEAKLKGHKGLQSYHQTVGTAQEPLVGIVSEFDVKKSKVKVFQANQHVGSQTVEAASYRLDDLKSGSVKVFRVAKV